MSASASNDQDTAAEALPAPLTAIASIILSSALVAIGNGLMFAFIPVRLGAEGLPPTWAGLILTGLSAGGMAGCFLTGRMVNRVGHARAFMTFSALIILSNVAVGVTVDPWLWIVARVLYGFAISGLFIVAQSWLNDVVKALFSSTAAGATLFDFSGKAVLEQFRVRLDHIFCMTFKD